MAPGVEVLQKNLVTNLVLTQLFLQNQIFIERLPENRNLQLEAIFF